VTNVLVTGANTSLGERLIRSLVADTRVGHVLAVGSDPADRAVPFANDARFTYKRVDLTKPRPVRELLFGPARDLAIEVVVHLSQHRSARGRGRKIHAENVEALRSILELSDRHPTIRRVVVRSYAVVYRVGLDLPVLVAEDHPMNLDPRAPQYVRDRVEADLTACARMGLSDAEIVVLRCAEPLGPGEGSQLYDYLSGPLAVRPMGFDPMVNVSTVADMVVAFEAATHGSGEGVFNIPGYDTLPLTEACRKWGIPSIPMPGPLVAPLYGLRHRLVGGEFTYGLNRKAMHFGFVLDGTRAREVLGFTPKHPVDWPIGGPVSF
jgi:UDP-glucose 4-epimerase